MLDGPRDEGHGPAGHGAGHGVADEGELLRGLAWVEEVVVERAAVDVEGSEHAAWWFGVSVLGNMVLFFSWRRCVCFAFAFLGRRGEEMGMVEGKVGEGRTLSP